MVLLPRFVQAVTEVSGNVFSHESQYKMIEVFQVVNRIQFPIVSSVGLRV